MRNFMLPKEIFLEEKLKVYQAFLDQFKNEEFCARYLLQIRLEEQDVCNECGKDPKWRLSSNKRFFMCSKCNERFYLTAGTVIERTKMPLTAWFALINSYPNISIHVSHLSIEADYRTVRSMRIMVWQMKAAFDEAEYENIYKYPHPSEEFMRMWHRFFFR